MEKVNLNEKEFNEMFKEPVFTSRSSSFYLIENEIFKCFNFKKSTYLDNKEYILSNLMFYRNLLSGIPIVLPNKLIYVNNILRGYFMDFIKGKTLQENLDNSFTTSREKIRYLKSIGKIIEEVKQLRDENHLNNFYLNDIHEENFIIDTKGKIHFIDVDSIRFFDSKIFPAKYLRSTFPINNFHKYKWYYGFEYGDYVANYDTDIYTYIIVITNTLLGLNSCKLTIIEYFNFLKLLRNCGISKDLTDIFSLIYTDKPNINPYLLLDELEYYFNSDDCDKVKKKLLNSV